MALSGLLSDILGNTALYTQLLRFFLILFAGAVVVRLIVMPVVAFFTRKRGREKKTVHTLQNAVGVTSMFIVLAIALQASSFGGIVTLLGAVTAGLTVAIGFGIRDQIANLLAGLFIKLDPPYVEKDYIRVNDVEGKVSEVKLRETRLKAPNGDKLVVPNNYLSNNPLRNSTKDVATTNKIKIRTAPEHVETAADLLKEIASEKDEVLEKPAPEVRHIEFDDGKVVSEFLYAVRDSEDLMEIRSTVIGEFNRRGQKAGLFEEPGKDEKK